MVHSAQPYYFPLPTEEHKPKETKMLGWTEEQGWTGLAVGLLGAAATRKKKLSDLGSDVPRVQSKV